MVYSFVINDNKRMNIKKTIGRRIARVREKETLTQEDLAEKTGFPISYISKVERGVISVGVFNLQKIASALGISMSELFKDC